jgi:hypothetical protein
MHRGRIDCATADNSNNRSHTQRALRNKVYESASALRANRRVGAREPRKCRPDASSSTNYRRRSWRRRTTPTDTRAVSSAIINYFTSVSILNIGRYIAMTMTPTISPTRIIISGSTIDVSD